MLQERRSALSGTGPAVVGLLLAVLLISASDAAVRVGSSPSQSVLAVAQTTLPQDTTRPGSSSVQSRRARALERRKAAVDPSKGVELTATILDSIRALPRDSSARLEHFHHVRRDLPMAFPTRQKTHPLYLLDPPQVRVEHDLDSLRHVYRIRRVLGGVDLRHPLELPFKEYAGLRLRDAIRKNWEDLAHSYTIEGEKKRGLGDLFGEVTSIEIPVPKNPLFSIFGPNIIRLQINGAVDIHGAFRNTTSDVFVNNPLGQSRNEPDFSQEVQVNVKGEIGDKLKIDADWNTNRQFEFENQLKVRYTGYEDDVVQSVEAGNVSLTTNSSFISSSQALFGIKAGFQFGPLKLTTVASQKKGQIRELSISGGGRPTPFLRRATDYSRDHYFIDTSYIAWFDSAYLNIPAVVNPRKQIRDIEVWVTRIGHEDPNERDVVAFIDEARVRATQNDLAARATDFDAVPGEVEVGRFIRLEPDRDYTYHEYAGFISMNRSLQPEQAIAVTYSLPDPLDPRRAVDVGNFGSRDTAKALKLVMKLVRPQKLGPQFKTAWRMMLKNIYPLGGRGIKKEGFELGILYEVPGREPQAEILGVYNLIEVFGLDRFGEQPGSPPDGKFDYAPGITINEARGELIFPRVEPFRESIRQFFVSKGRTIAEADSFVFHEVYDTTYNGASNSQRNKFLIKGTITSAIASTYQIGFNVVEGSVQVLASGNPLRLNEDYSVDYISGQVTIRNPQYLVPGTDLQIRYEANDLFQLASKSLLGARGELAISKSSALGFTIMNLNQQTLSDKVRLNEEPISNTIFGIDGGTRMDLEFLTRALNVLPGIRTNAMSTLTMRGEAAYMLPDPNTRKSPIAQDRGAGIAYIDDFEGARRTIPLSINYGAWRDASVPDYMRALDDPVKQTPQQKIEYKGRMIWYNVQPSDVYVGDIWPNRSVRRGEEQVTVLNLYFRPQERGAFNYSMELESKLFANPRKAWAGIQRLIGSTATNLLDENINFIEFWIRIDRSQPTARLNISLGLISEDAIPNNRLDTEDGLDGGIRNGVLAPVEDVGLDGLTDQEERVRFAEFIAKYPQYATDPSGDNWARPVLGSLRPEDYASVNGTEGNRFADVGQRPDTEDLNGNNVLDRVNSYFEYEILLDTTSVDFQRFVSGGGANNWYQIRIPITEYSHKVGDPSFSTIEGMRLWVTGAESDLLVRITDLNLVGNQWEELVKNDSTFRITVVNVEDNPGYEPPVPQAKDRTRPDENILLNEQSLNLVITGLKDGETRQALKRFPVRPLDLFSYRAMKMFVHGDDRPGYRLRYIDSTNYDLEFFFRFGSDSLNYYEYRAPIRPGWQDIVILFSDITAIKLGRDSAGAISPRVPVPNGPPGSTYQVRGTPTLTNVRLLVLGVENPPDKGSPSVTGEVWVNELRLTEVDDTPGWAYRFETSLKLADVANVSFNLTQRDPHFHALEERFGTRNTDRNWTLSASVGLERFLPQSWAGTSLGVSYSRVEQIQNPRYVPGTDIPVREAADRIAELGREEGLTEEEAARGAENIRLESQTLAVVETYALPNIKLNIPVDSWLIAETINRLSFGYSYNRSTRRSPTTQSFNQWQWNTRMSYGVQFGDRNYFSPFSIFGDFFLTKPWKDLKIRFLPRGINLSTTFARGQTNERARNQAEPKPTVRNFSSTRSMNFQWQLTEGGFLNLGTEYAVDVQSSLLNFELDEFGRQRAFSQIVGDIFGKEKLIDFGTDLSYGQTISFTPRPVVPPILKLDKLLSMSARYSSRYEWTNNPQAGDLGKSAGNSGNLTLSFDFNVRSLGNEIWPAKVAKALPTPTDTAVAAKGVSIWEGLDNLTRIALKTPFFDFERLNVSFTQTNRSQNSGVLGRAGFSNVFGRIPFFQESLPDYGPSLMYQLGLASDPHGPVILKTKGAFPFVTGYSVPGPRAPKGNLVDNYAQSNRLTMRTSRPLWEGASLEVNWNVGWSYNVNRTLASDSLGVAHESNKVVSGDLDRSFLTFPPVLFFKFFKTGVEDVQKEYERLRSDSHDKRSNDAKLAQAFEDGLEALPLLKKILGNILPRANWTLRWDGLEKLPGFSSFASRASFDHGYSSGYKRRWKTSPTGDEVTESQQVNYGFNPLIGLNVTFKELLKGNFGASFRLSNSTSYDLTPSVQNIVESQITDITVSANYTRQGFEIPFFGLALSNDLDVSFSYSYSKNSRRVYDLKAVNFKKEGTPLEGSSRTIIEPRIRYILSSRVTASVYYKYTKLKPDEGGSRIPGSTVNEGGLDVRVAIQP